MKIMKKLTNKEIKKRGCKYCSAFCKDRYENKCKHNVCPYPELDNYDTYNDYLKATKDTDFLEILLNL